MLNRRQLLQLAAAGAPAIAVGAALPSFLARTARAAAIGARRDDGVLVVLEMTGGNDGLNTVVPYADDLYHRARPKLRIDPREVTRVNDRAGLHPRMKPLEELLCDGRLAIVQGVGYPNPIRSHFESMDIWHSADASRQSRSGWLGQALAQSSLAPKRLPALHVGVDESPLALAGAPGGAPTIHPSREYGLDLSLAIRQLNSSEAGPRNAKRVPASPADGARSASTVARMNFIRELTATPGSSAGPVDFVRQASLGAYETVDRLNEVLRTCQAQNRSADRLATRLEIIAHMIEIGLDARVYYASLDGFDTHADQPEAHGDLLGELAEGISSFFKLLDQKGAAQRVTLMTFSEFGRRVAENDSAGTDHGAASCMFLAGPNVRGGLVGECPSLADLDDGDLRYHTDFRRVYASVLEDWLGCDSQAVLGQPFEKLPLFAAPKNA